MSLFSWMMLNCWKPYYDQKKEPKDGVRAMNDKVKTEKNLSVE